MLLEALLLANLNFNENCKAP